jgi:hypothetical protein
MAWPGRASAPTCRRQGGAGVSVDPVPATSRATGRRTGPVKANLIAPAVWSARLLEPPADALDEIKTCLEVVFAQMPEPRVSPPMQASRKAGQGDERPGQYSEAEANVVIDQVNP